MIFSSLSRHNLHCVLSILLRLIYFCFNIVCPYGFFCVARFRLFLAWNMNRFVFSRFSFPIYCCSVDPCALCVVSRRCKIVFLCFFHVVFELSCQCIDTISHYTTGTPWIFFSSYNVCPALVRGEAQFQ